MRPGQLIHVLAAALLVGVLVSAALSQGTDGTFPRPLGLGGLWELLEGQPLDDPAQRTAIMDAHAAYLQVARQLREGEISALMRGGYAANDSLGRVTYEAQRTRLALKLDAAERTLFEQVQLIFGEGAEGGIRAARRMRERQLLLQMFGGWEIQVSADVVFCLLELPMKTEERAQALAAAAPIEERIVAALRQLRDAVRDLPMAQKRELAAAGLTDNWQAQLSNPPTQASEDLRRRGDEAIRTAYAQVLNATFKVIDEERAGLRRVLQVLPASLGARLQRAFYERAYQDLTGAFSPEVEAQARQALRHRSLSQSESDAIREVLSSWLAAEALRAEAVADVIDAYRRDTRLETDWSPERDEAKQVQLSKLGGERAAASERACAAIRAILGPDRSAKGADTHSVDLRPPEEIVLVGLDEVPQGTDDMEAAMIASLSGGSPGGVSPATQRVIPSVPRGQDLTDLIEFLGLNEDESSVLAILLDGAASERLQLMAQWKQLVDVEGGSSVVVDGQETKPPRIRDDGDEARTVARLVADRTALRRAVWKSEDNIWDGVAALLPEENRWRVEFVRLTRTMNFKRELNRNHWGELQLHQVQPDLAEVVLSAGLDQKQRQAFCQQVIDSAQPVRAAAEAIDSALDEQEVQVATTIRRGRAARDDEARQLWGRARETWGLRRKQAEVAKAALQALVQSIVEAAIKAAQAEGASAENLQLAVRRASYPGVWESELDPGRFIQESCVAEALRAADGDSGADANLLSARLEPVRENWAAPRDQCCESLMAIAIQLAELKLAPKGDISVPGRVLLLQEDSGSRCFYRDEMALHALERLAVVLGTERCAGLTGFPAALNTLRKRSARPVDW